MSFDLLRSVAASAAAVVAVVASILPVGNIYGRRL